MKGGDFKIEDCGNADCPYKLFNAALAYRGNERVTYVLEMRPELVNVRHCVLADYLGLSRETVTRAISAWKKRGNPSPA